MKKLLLIALLFIPVLASAQYKNSWIKTDTIKSNKDPFISVAKPFQYTLGDSSTWNDNTLVTKRWVLDRLGSGGLSFPLSVDNGYFQLKQAEGTVFFEWSKAGIKMGASSENFWELTGTGITYHVPPRYSSDWRASYTDRTIPDWGNVNSAISDAISEVVVTETDPVFTSSPAFGITSGKISTWDELVSFPGFGTNHSTAAYGDHSHDGVYQPVGSYLTGNQPITLSGDASGSGTTAITVTLPNIATAGIYNKVTVNTKGQVTAGTNPTTLAGYGITDAIQKSTETVINPDSIGVIEDGILKRAAVTSIPYGYYTNINAYGTGYNLTNTSALVDFSTTDPQITITQSGTWKINAGVYINYVGATVTNQTLTFKLRRTNNTAADVVSTPTLNLTPCTTTNGFGAFIQLPPFWYSTSNANDVLALWGNISATLSQGNIQVVGAWITAEKIVD